MCIKYSFMGQVNNETIKRFYRDNRVTCFITTSSSEGLPVSVMEAMSYGIPIIATDVGGISEMVEDNGILLSSEAMPEQVADAIEMLIFMDDEDKYNMRSSSYAIWKDKFDACINSQKFACDTYRKYGSELDTLIITIDSVYADWCFVENEIRELSKWFRIILIETKPEKDKEKIERGKRVVEAIDADIQLFRYFPRGFLFLKIIYFFRYWIDNSISVERNTVKNRHASYIRCSWESIKYYISSELFYRWIKKEEIIKGENPVIFYTFWQQDTTLAMCRHKKNTVIITRTHGYDLYDERYLKGKRQPFREFMDPLLDEVFFVSKAGKEYYLKKYGVRSENKYCVRYLGSTTTDNGIINRKDDDRGVVIVSCSNVIPLKRLDIIIDALAILKKRHSRLDLEWVHFGDGPMLGELKEYARKMIGDDRSV